MSAAGLARFAMSAQGDFYRRICELRGIDPGAALMAEDDVLAHDFAAALYIAKPETEAADEGKGIVTDLEAQMEAMLHR